MALAIDIVHGHRPSNKMHSQLWRRRLSLGFISPAKVVLALYITNKTEHGPCHRYDTWAWSE